MGQVIQVWDVQGVFATIKQAAMLLRLDGGRVNAAADRAKVVNDDVLQRHYQPDCLPEN